MDFAAVGAYGIRPELRRFAMLGRRFAARLMRRGQRAYAIRPYNSRIFFFVCAHNFFHAYASVA